MLSSHLLLSLRSGLFTSGFPTKKLYTPLFSSRRATFPTHLILLDFITRTILGANYASLSSSLCHFLHSLVIAARSKRNGTRAETRFGLSAKRAGPFKSAGVSVQSTTGSRGVRISGQQLYRPCSDVQCKTTGYPLHSHLSPSLPLPCVAVCHQVLNALYLVPLRPKYSPQRPIFKHSQPSSSHNVSDQVSHPHKTIGKIIVLYVLTF